MPVTLAVRGNSLTARYAGGWKEAAVLDASRTGGIPEVVADATAIGGFKIDMEGNMKGGLSYSSRENFTKTGNFSVLLRIDFSGVAGTNQIWRWGRPSAQFSQPLFETNLKQSSGGFQTYQYNDAAILGIGGTYITSDSMVDNVWYDLVFTWNNTTGVYSAYKDAVLLGTQTTTVKYLNPSHMHLFGELVFGHGNFADGAAYNLNEMIFWDEVIDPTNVPLVGGAGSLNGATRTAFVDVAEFDGLAPAPSGGGGGGGSLGFNEFGF